MLRGLIDPNVKLCPVVKDDCYGHGMDVLYPVLAERVDGFAVASPTEALELRHRGYAGFILCFLSAYFDDYDIQDELVRQGITQTVMSKSALASVQAAAERTGGTAPVHLKVDTVQHLNRAVLFYQPFQDYFWHKLSRPGFHVCYR